MVNTTLNKFGKKLPPVKTGQRFGEEIKKDKKVGLFSERRFLIFTKRGPIEIAFKPIHYASVIMTTIIGLTSIVSDEYGYLHDGRARTIEEAILWHGGEANEIIQNYKKLNKNEVNQLLSFINSL